MPWRAAASPVAALTLGLLVLLVLVGDVALALTLARIPLSLTAFGLALLIGLSLPLLAVLVYWLWGLFSLRYYLDRNALTIRWAGAAHVVPLPRIRAIVEGSTVAEAPVVRGLRWPGYVVGEAQLGSIGRTLVFSTRPLAEQLIVVTPSLAYAISPVSPRRFLDELASRQRLGPTEHVAQTVRVAPLLALPFWRDRVARGLLGAAIVLCLGLLAWVSLRYPSLPAELPLRGAGVPPLPRATALILPAIGLGALVVNSLLAVVVHARERFAAYLALGGALAAQGLLWLRAAQGL